MKAVLTSHTANTGTDAWIGSDASIVRDAQAGGLPPPPLAGRGIACVRVQVVAESKERDSEGSS
ncbi:hypothetical protein ABIE91_005548 [Bradyrhizobium elkanii]